MFMCHRRDLYYINITQFGQPCDLLTPQLRGVSYIGLWTLLSSSQSFAVIQFTPTLPAPDSSGFSWLVGCILGSVAWNVPSLHCRGGISFAETPNFQVIMYYEDYYIRQTCMLHALIYMLLLTNLSLSLSLSLSLLIQFSVFCDCHINLVNH